MRDFQTHDKVLLKFHNFQKKIVPPLCRNLELLTDGRLRDNIRNDLFEFIRNRAINNIIGRYINDVYEASRILKKVIGYEPFQGDDKTIYNNFKDIRNMLYIHRMEISLSSTKKYRKLKAKYNTALKRFNVAKELGDIIYKKIEQMLSENKIKRIPFESFEAGEKEYKDEDIDKLVAILNNS